MNMNSIENASVFIDDGLKYQVVCYDLYRNE